MADYNGVTIPQLPTKALATTDYFIITDTNGASGKALASDLMDQVAEQINDEIQDIQEVVDQIYDQFSLADRLGTYNAATGAYVISETGVTGTLTTTPAFSNGKYFDVTTEGTNSVTGTSRAWKIGDKIISAVTKWDALPFAIGDGIVSAAKLGTDIAYKNFPFISTSTANAIIKAGITNIVVQGSILSSTRLAIAVLIRNGTVSSIPNTWRISIYDYTSGSFGAIAFHWQVVSYVPSANIETIVIPGTGVGLGSSIHLTIDWTQIPDLTDLISQTTSIISPITYRPVPSDNAISNVKLTSDVVCKNYPFAPDITPDTILRNSIKNIRIKGFVGPNKKMTFAVYRRNVTVSSVANTWQLRIYDCTSGSIGTLLYDWTKVNYVPSADVETLEIPGYLDYAVGTTLYLTIDWAQLPNLTSVAPVEYSGAGLSPFIFESYARYPFEFVVPPIIRVLSGNKIWFYDDALIFNSERFEKNPMRLDLTAKKVSDNATVSPYSYVTGNGELQAYSQDYNATLLIQDYTSSKSTDNNPSVILSKTILVKTITKPTGTNKTVMVIGDSYFDNQYGDGIFEYIAQFAVADTNSITWKGIRTSHGQASEARASWNESTFYRYIPVASRVSVNTVGSDANLHSPFMFSTNDTALNKYFSFSEYLTTYSQTAPQVIVFFLGMNGGDGSQINTMITNIRSTHPAIKIVVCTVPGAEKYGRANNNSITRQLGRLTQSLSYLTKFAGREAENIYVCPVHMGFHRVYGLGNSTKEQVQFNLNSVPLELINTDHHPNATGAKGLAYMIYNYIFGV